MTHTPQLTKEQEVRFDEKFPSLSLVVTDKTGGFDATPYVKQFLAEELALQRTHLLQKVREKVINIEPKQWGYAIHQVRADIRHHVFRQLELLSTLEKEKTE